MKKPLVDGINPLNELKDFGDLWWGIMDVLIDVEERKIDHIKGTERVCDIMEFYEGNQK